MNRDIVRDRCSSSSTPRSNLDNRPGGLRTYTFVPNTLARHGVPGGSDRRVGARPAGQRWWQRSHHHLLLMGWTEDDARKRQPSKQKQRGGKGWWGRRASRTRPPPPAKARPSLANRCIILPAPHPLFSRHSLSLHAPYKVFHPAQKQAKELPTTSQAKKQKKKQLKQNKKNHVFLCACVKVSFGLIEGDQRCVLLRGRSAEETQGLLLFSFRMYLGESSEQAECLNQSVLISSHRTLIPL